MVINKYLATFAQQCRFGEFLALLTMIQCQVRESCLVNIWDMTSFLAGWLTVQRKSFSEQKNNLRSKRSSRV